MHSAQRDIFGRVLTTLVAVAYLSACATRAADVKAQDVSASQYEAASCEQLREMLANTNLRLVQLSQEIDHNANVDAASVAGAVAMVFVLPFGFAMTHGDGPKQAEYSRLLGEQRAMEEQLQRKQCGDLAVPAVAAPAAISPDEVQPAARPEPHEGL